MARSRIDLTEFVPGSLPAPARRGHLHLVTQTQAALEDVFVGMGFEVEEGPEIETDWYNFEALNIPPAHPARGMWDTFYLNSAPREHVLRTHTSPVQIHLMERALAQGTLPIHAVMPGRCYRRDTPDARHLPVFHQIEGLVVDRGITFADLAGTIEVFTTAYFGPDIHSRLRPAYFPFTEPSAEFEVTCTICLGAGCQTCSQTGWIELGGCGMVDPAVFDAVGIDADQWTGFAFGFGIDRCAQMRHQIADMRVADGQRHPLPASVLMRALRGRPCAYRFRGSETSPPSTGIRPSWPRPSTTWVWWSREWSVSARASPTWSSPGSARSTPSRVPTGSGGWWSTTATGPVEVVCGAWNFEVGDLVPLAPVGAVLPGDFAIARRKMKGVVSNGMLCSGRELGVSDDHEGILVLNGSGAPRSGGPLTAALGIEPDVVFDVAVEANRPDAWSMVGVARDLAARLRLPFAVPEPGRRRPEPSPVRPSSRWPRCVSTISSCARGSPPGWSSASRWDRRHSGSPVVSTLAGMRPINNVVDASNYVMLELGQPTHPYDLDRLAGHGLLVRRARPGETVTTLDGVERSLGRPGPGLGDTGQDCLICDAEGAPVGIGGVMGGASSEIDDSTTPGAARGGLLRPHGHRPDLQAPESEDRGLGPFRARLRSGRHRPGRGPILRAVGPDGRPGDARGRGVIDVTGDVPTPEILTVRPSKVNALLGTDFAGRRHRRAPRLPSASSRRAEGAGPDGALGWWCRRTDPTSARPRWGRPTSPRRWRGHTATSASPAIRHRGRSPDVSAPPAGPAPAQRGAVRSRMQRGVDVDVRLGGRSAELGRRAPLHRGDQPSGRVGAVPPIVDDARAAPGCPLQHRAPPARHPAVRGRFGLPPPLPPQADTEGRTRRA